MSACARGASRRAYSRLISILILPLLTIENSHALSMGQPLSPAYVHAVADVARKALVQVQVMVRDLLMEHMTEAKATDIAVKLSTGTWTHDYAITAEEAKALGLPVTTEVPRPRSRATRVRAGSTASSASTTTS